MQVDGGFLHAQFLLRQAQIDAALLALQLADDLGFGGLQLGLFDVVLGAAQVALVLLGGDARVGDGLVQRGLRLFQRGLFFVQLLLRAAGIEAHHRIAFLHGPPGGACHTMRSEGTFTGAVIWTDRLAFSSPRQRTITEKSPCRAGAVGSVPAACTLRSR